MLDRQHLLGEHVELHTIFSVIVNNKKGYSKHPQTLRFKNTYGLSMLADRHDKQVIEMKKRGYNHKSPLPYTIIHVPYFYSDSDFKSDMETLRSRNGLLEK